MQKLHQYYKTRRSCANLFDGLWHMVAKMRSIRSREFIMGQFVWFAGFDWVLEIVMLAYSGVVDLRRIIKM